MVDSIFRAYDIRAVYGEDIDEGIAYLIGKAVVAFTNASKVLVGRDMRESSPSMKDALVRGIRDQGADVVEIGLCSTPMFYWATQKFEAGVMVTASHNPPEYNGFKICRNGAEPVGGNNGLKEIEKLVLSQAFPQVEKKGEQSEQEFLDSYIDYNLQFLKTDRNLKVVVDAGNGMGGHTYDALRNKLPSNIEFVPMFFELDGSFPNRNPNPVKPEALEKVRKRVIEEKADLGIALDGDGDRITFIDNKGESIPSDIMMAILTKQILVEHPGALILYDIRSSWVVKEEAENAGGKAMVTRVGHAFVKTDMREHDALFACELSGHFYNAIQQPMENTHMILFMVLNLLGNSGQTMSEVSEELRGRYAKTEETNFEVANPKEIIQKLSQAYENKEGVTAVSHVDGVRVDFEDWWFDVRPSNTEPLLRLNLEAKTKELMNEKLAELKEFIEKF